VNYGFLCGRTAEPAKGAATISDACRKYTLIYNECKTINPGAPLLAGCAISAAFARPACG
jgi:hypothetical protein